MISAYVNQAQPSQKMDSKSKIRIARKNSLANKIGVEASNKNAFGLKSGLNILAGLYFLEKGITSGLTRLLGVRLEEHTTSGKNAKKIIENGCILNPEFGGTGCSKNAKQFGQNSKNYVHITGVHEDYKKVYKFSSVVGDLPQKEFMQAEKKLEQKFVYKMASIPDDCKGILSKIKAFFNSKTFYIGGTDEYFNKNFIPDTDEIALKTTECLKVSKTKIGATIRALKEQGLSGIKQNPNRIVTGILFTVGCFALAYKFIKNGFAINKNEDNK